ncbi:MAG: GxxExxY protein [Phycisphaera sp.]|nr:MAG: GxxExxY protein [Phycisphaera sp.]
MGESWRAEGEKDELTREIIGAAIEVHRALGPGLLESAYEACLAAELEDRGIRFQAQVPLPVLFKGRSIEAGYRMDLVVKDRVIVELKAIEKLLLIHEAQLLTYLKLSGLSTGLILNFNTPYLRDGIIRKVLS